MTILCLCREQHHWKLIPGYADAFRRHGIEFFCVDDSIPFDAPLEDVLQTCPGTPSTIFHFESAHPLFPIGLERSEIPTVCFHPDTYAFTERRMHWSAVFDHAAVFHPGYDERFKRAGHPRSFFVAARRSQGFFPGRRPIARIRDCLDRPNQRRILQNPRPNGCRNLRRNFTPTIGRAGTPSQRLPTSIAVRKLLSISAATIFPRTQISASSRSLPPAPCFSPQCPRSSPSSAFNKALTSWATAIPRGTLVLAEPMISAWTSF